MSDESGVANDPRWHKFNRTGLTCSCGEHHVGLFAIHMLVPLGWTGAREYAPNDQLRLDGTFLSENFCVWQGQHFALRMRLPIQVKGALPHALVYTVWASVERADMVAYVAALKSGTLNNNTQFGARLVNKIAGYPDTSSLMGVAFQQEDGGPPLLLIAGPQMGALPSHPLFADQRQGIDFDRILELYAVYGHEMRGVPAATSH